MYCVNIAAFQKSKCESMNFQEMAYKRCALFVLTLSESCRTTDMIEVFYEDQGAAGLKQLEQTI